MVGSEVYSAEVKKTEILMENFRRAIGLRIKEVKEVYEGEVTELKPIESVSSSDTTSYTKTISHVLIGLKTTKNAKKLKLDASIYDELVKEGVEIGDIIYIEANSGNVKRVGKSDFFASEFDLEKETYVPVPKGDVHKKKEVLQNVTLHDLDAANAKPAGSKDLAAIVNNLRGKKTEITEKLRGEINKVVNKYVEQGLCEVIPGVLFIDEVHMLDLECFTFLNKSLESELSPVLVLATNRGVSRVRGSDLKSAHGIPVDLLDRLLIVRTMPYNAEHAVQILALRANTEGVKIVPEALKELAKLAGSASLRYAAQLLTPSLILAKAEGIEAIGTTHVAEADRLFADAKRSAKRLIEQEDDFLK